MMSKESPFSMVPIVSWVSALTRVKKCGGAAVVVAEVENVVVGVVEAVVDAVVVAVVVVVGNGVGARDGTEDVGSEVVGAGVGSGVLEAEERQLIAIIAVMMRHVKVDAACMRHVKVDAAEMDRGSIAAACMNLRLLVRTWQSTDLSTTASDTDPEHWPIVAHDRAAWKSMVDRGPGHATVE